MKKEENKDFFNQKIGKRLREVLNEYAIDKKGKKIKQGEIAYNIGVTEQHLSYILNGHRPLTRDIAQLIIDTFCPEVRISYLLGLDDDKTKKDIAINTMNRALDEGENMNIGIFAFGKSLGFEFSNKTEKDFENYDDDDLDEKFGQAIDNWFTIRKEGKTVQLSINEMHKLRNEIAEYIEFKLNKLF